MSGSTWKAKGKCGVLIVTIRDDFQPQRPHDLPDHFAAGELFVKNVPLISALGFCAAFNKRALQRRLDECRWAIPIRRGHMFFDPAELDDANWQPQPARANSNGQAHDAADNSPPATNDFLGSDPGHFQPAVISQEIVLVEGGAQ